MRKDKSKAVKYNILIGDQSVELYDLDTDSSENKDLADLHPEIIEELVDIMKEARTDSPIFTFK